ncbi:hypothetical protein, partial [Algibacter sp.]|uniref:hypothetical protein n=1 Tax=Algibacter sp. TaxID=1872428 RepID=UPI003C767B64
MIALFSNPNYKNLYFVIPLLLIWGFLFLKNRKSIFNFRKAITTYLSKTFSINWLSLVFLLLLCFYAIYLPLSYDEAYTFLQFVDRSLFYAFCTYPAPNNHVFHSIFSN